MSMKTNNHVNVGLLAQVGPDRTSPGWEFQVGIDPGQLAMGIGQAYPNGTLPSTTPPPQGKHMLLQLAASACICLPRGDDSNKMPHRPWIDEASSRSINTERNAARGGIKGAFEGEE